MKKILLFIFLTAFIAYPSQQARAQTFSIGGHLGYDVEYENTFAGGQARIGGGGFPLVFQPGIEFGLGDDAQYTWLEGNLLYKIGEAYTFAFTPYLGTGVSAEFFDEFGETESELGINFLAGVEIGGLASNIVPFAQVRYTVGSGPDPAALMGGILFRFGGY